MKPTMRQRLSMALRNQADRLITGPVERQQINGRVVYPGYGGGLMGGGLYNAKTGAGTSADSSEASFFTPTRIYVRTSLEVMYAQSWACRKFIDIPVDDMFIRWREWKAENNETAADAMLEADERLRVQSRLATAMKAGRLYGTSLLVMMTAEAPMETRLIPEQVRPGDFKALRVFDRYSASVIERTDDPFDPNYQRPEFYRLTPQRGQPFTVHHSRVLRFDGLDPLNDDGYTIYDQDWGISEVVPAALAILQDQAGATAVAHLMAEASIPILKVTGLRRAMASNYRPDPEDPSVEDIGETLNRLKSVFRLLMMDKTEEFERVPVTFAGLADILDRYARRLAACAGIPATRFWSMSPVGMNSTGESDMANYGHYVDAMREQMLPDVLRRLDEVLARDAGVAEVPEYDFPSLVDQSETDQAAAAVSRATALQVAYDSGAIDEDDFRAAIDGTPIFGQLPGAAPELPDPPVPDPNAPPMPGGPPGDPPAAV